jgi:hypothetical protein
MKKKKRFRSNGGFFIALGFNLIFNLEWTIPAWIFLALHFALNISTWWFVGALLIWVLIIALYTSFLCWVSRASNTPEIKKENKNPYSAKTVIPKPNIGGDNNENV